MKKKKLMASINLSLGFGLALACAFLVQSPPVAAQAAVSKYEGPGSVFMPCANYELGEIVDFDATMHQVDRNPAAADGAEHESYSVGRGVGEATGDDYSVSLVRNALPAADGDYLNTLKVQSGGTDGVSYTLRWVGSADPAPENIVHEHCGYRGETAPNILFILADDLGAEATSVYPQLAGNIPQVRMPNIEALAANGVVFDNVWADPVCSPARAQILTGRNGHDTSVLWAGDPLPPAETTIFEALAMDSPESYAMAAFGKWHLAPDLPPLPFLLQQRIDLLVAHLADSGVPEFRGHLGGGISNYFDWITIDNFGNSANTTEYSTTAITDYAIEFIETHRASANADDPWFAYVAYNAPHGVGASTGFQVPPADLHSFEWLDENGFPVTDPLWQQPLFGSGPNGELQPGDVRPGSILIYQAMIEALDREIGRLLEAVGPVGSPERENTVVVFMGDNGTPWVVKDPSAAVSGYKTQVAEGGVRVPLIVSGAGVHEGRRGKRDNSLVEATDLFATVADLARADGAVSDGFSLLPLLDSPSVDATGRELAIAEYCAPDNYGSARRYAIRDQRYKLSFNSAAQSDPPIVPPGGLPFLAGYPADGWGLYDLQNDLRETNNLVDTGIPEQGILEAELQQVISSAAFGCFEE